jgi:hypothetical protein
MAISSDYFNDYGNSKLQYMEEMMRRKEKEMMAKARAMQNVPPEWVESGSGAADVVASKPKKAAFLNQKLLLTKGS